VVDVEEAAAEAFATAVERWPADGVPPNPGAWLTTTGDRNLAVDRSEGLKLTAGRCEPGRGTPVASGSEVVPSCGGFRR
jgi:predicted RNA polymerase sigma factor